MRRSTSLRPTPLRPPCLTGPHRQTRHVAQRWATTLALLGAVAASLPCAALAQAAAAPAASAASAPADGVRSQLFAPLSAAQELVAAQQHAAALARLKEADAVTDKTPYEAYVTERLRIAAAVGVGDAAQAERSFEALAASARMSPAERPQLMQAVLSSHYRAKDYPRAITWAQRLRQEPGATAAMREQAQHLLPQALYLTRDYAGAARELQAELKANEAAARPPAEDRLRLLASSLAQLKDLPGYVAVMEKLVTHHPKKEHWADLIGRVESREGFGDRLVLDALRLKAVVCGGLDEAADVQTLAEMAQQGGQALEARRWIQQAYASGQFGSGPQAGGQARLRDVVQRAAADDEAALRGKGPAVREAVALANWGQIYIAAGQTERGLAMMEEALAKGGLKRAEDIRLRLGAAYAQAGQTEKAVRTLAAVQGSDGTADLARLWLLHLKQPVPAR